MMSAISCMTKNTGELWHCFSVSNIVPLMMVFFMAMLWWQHCSTGCCIVVVALFFGGNIACSVAPLALGWWHCSSNGDISPPALLLLQLWLCSLVDSISPLVTMLLLWCWHCCFGGVAVLTVVCLGGLGPLAATAFMVLLLLEQCCSCVGNNTFVVASWWQCSSGSRTP